MYSFISGKDDENDYLNGTELTDFIYGLSGSDLLFGQGGDDYLFGGVGNDLHLSARGLNDGDPVLVLENFLGTLAETDFVFG